MKALSIFISYSHHDEKFQQELTKHLSPLQRRGTIKAWHDRCIPAGAKWAAEIDGNIEKADLILALVSADFIASDYCYEKEMGRALERHESGNAIVIPVIIRSVVWDDTPLARLQALPKDARPVEEWKYPDRAWTDVVRGVMEVSKGIFSGSNLVREVSRETNTHLDVTTEKIDKVDDLDVDEVTTENLVDNWKDIKHISNHFPQLASLLAEYRRDSDALESLKQRQYKQAMELTQSNLPIEIITFLTILISMENLEERIKVRIKEIEILQEIDTVRKEQRSAVLELQLYPERLGLSVNQVMLAEHLLDSEMNQYAETVKKAENVATLVKKVIIEPLKRLGEK